jgi:hypothetical protein
MPQLAVTAAIAAGLIAAGAIAFYTLDFPLSQRVETAQHRAYLLTANYEGKSAIEPANPNPRLHESIRNSVPRQKVILPVSEPVATGFSPPHAIARPRGNIFSSSTATSSPRPSPLPIFATLKGYGAQSGSTEWSSPILQTMQASESKDPNQTIPSAKANSQTPAPGDATENHNEAAKEKRAPTMRGEKTLENSRVSAAQPANTNKRVRARLFTPEEERYRQQIGVQAFINFQHELATGQIRTAE